MKDINPTSFREDTQETLQLKHEGIRVCCVRSGVLVRFAGGADADATHAQKSHERTRED